jgi:hypothetical protein
MLWQMLSRLETCIIYSCIWSVTLAKLHSQCALSGPISSSRKTRKSTVCRFILTSIYFWRIGIYPRLHLDSHDEMLWRMLSRLEICIVYSCILSVSLAKSIVPRKTWHKLWQNLSPITFRLPWWKHIENLTCIFVKNILEM